MSDNLYCIITEYCEGGSMLNFIQDGKHYSEQVLKVVMRKLFNALSYMHRLNIVHRDIKLDNIVLVNKFESEADADKLEIRLIDFGLAKVLPNKRIKDKEKVGTYTHMAPEVLKGIYSTKCDIWSAGVLLFLMVSGSSPFKKATKELTYEGILNDDLRFEGILPLIKEKFGEEPTFS
jgi:calcium-dependent protein kinase